MPERSHSAHEVFLQFHRHRASSVLDLNLKSANEDDDDKGGTPATGDNFDMFHHVMKTGVIYATSRARSFGFQMEDPQWANMGQGAPETGLLPGAPSRDFHMNIQDAELEYAPTAGITELRQKVAEYYNFLYRCVGVSLFLRDPSVFLHVVKGQHFARQRLGTTACHNHEGSCHRPITCFPTSYFSLGRAKNPSTPTKTFVLSRAVDRASLASWPLLERSKWVTSLQIIQRISKPWDCSCESRPAPSSTGMRARRSCLAKNFASKPRAGD